MKTNLRKRLIIPSEYGIFNPILQIWQAGVNHIVCITTMKKLKNLKNKKGQASMVDVLLFSVILIAAATALFVYAEKHKAAVVEDVQQQALDEYASKTLRSMYHVRVSSNELEYETVQQFAVKKVNDPHVQKVRELVNKLNDIVEVIEDIEEKIYQGNMEVNNQINTARSLTSQAQSLTNVVSDTSYLTSNLGNIDSYTSGGILGSLSSGTSGGGVGGMLGKMLGGLALNYLSNVIPSAITGSALGTGGGSLSDLNSELSGLNSQLSEFDSDMADFQHEVNSNSQDILDELEKVKCKIVNIKSIADHYLSYVETGISMNDPTFFDLLVVETNPKGRTLTQVTDECLYVKDNLAETEDVFQWLTIAAYLFRKENIGMSDSKKEIVYGILHRPDRMDYEEEAEELIEKRLNNILDKQGYDYCFIAKNCCEEIKVHNCGSIPDVTDASIGFAKSPIVLVNGEKGEMQLYIWRK